jgi:hypothetical protein
LHETDQPFFEPGLFMINGDGLIHTLDVSHSPFVRPDLCGALNGITFIRKTTILSARPIALVDNGCASLTNAGPRSIFRL